MFLSFLIVSKKPTILKILLTNKTEPIYNVVINKKQTFQHERETIEYRLETR